MGSIRSKIKEFLLGKSHKNKVVREFLTETCQNQIHNNLFEFGNLQVQLDPDSPWRGVNFTERLYISVYDTKTEVTMRFYVQVSEVEFEFEEK